MSEFIPPKHIGFIMDGNGRWATARGLDRAEGHIYGYRTMLQFIEYAYASGIPELSFFAFSTDNDSKRTQSEKSGICKLVLDFCGVDAQKLIEEGIRIHFFGNLSKLPTEIKKAVEKVNADSLKNDKMLVAIALNYGGKEDILQAAKSDRYELNLQTNPLSPVDMLVRTGGEKRLSNFMLYLLGYAELMFDDVLWPDADKTFFDKVLNEYERRNRRFGGYGEKNE